MDLFALLQCQTPPGEAAKEVGQHGLHFVEEGAGGMGVRMGEEIVHLAQHLQRGVQALAVVGVHGVHGPGLDHAAIEAVERFHHAAGELVADLDVGAGDAVDPAEDEVLAVAVERREDVDQLVHLVEGELDIEGGFQPERELLRGIGNHFPR